MQLNVNSSDLKPIKTIILGITLLFVWYLISITFELTLISIYKDTEKFFDSFHYLVIDWLLENLILIIIVLALLKKNKQSLVDLGWKSEFDIKRIAQILCLGIVLWIAQDQITYYSKTFLPENFPANEIQKIFEEHFSVFNNIILFILVVIITPICEEVFMRGFIYRSLRYKYNIYISILISTIIFIIFHPVLAWIPALVIANIVICYIYEKTNIIWAPILLHATNNFIEYLNKIFTIVST